MLPSFSNPDACIPMFYRIAAIVALLFFTACASNEAPAPIRKAANQTTETPMDAPILTPQQPQGRIVKIGLLVPLTGDAAAVGSALQDAATLAIADRYGTASASADEIRVVLVPKDTGGTPEIAAEATRQVLASGADLIIGPLFSTQVKAVADVARPAGVNVITFSNNPEVAGSNVFVFGFLVEQQVERVLNYALNRNIQNIALLAPNNPYGQSVQSTTKALLTSSNLSLAAEAYYNPNTAPATEIDHIAAQNAAAPLGAILLPESGQKLQATVKSLAAKGLSQPTTRLLGTGLWDDAANLRSGVLTGGWFPSSPPERFSAYEKRFHNYFGYAPSRISSLAYDAVALAAALVSNSVDGKVPAAAITEESGFVGPVNGLFRCKHTGICERGLAVLEVTAKGARVIDPAPSSF